jgi:hypothetical protein
VIGSNSVIASYGGATGLETSTSIEPAVVKVTLASTQIHAGVVYVFRGKEKEPVKMIVRTQVEPRSPGAGVPTGEVTLDLIRKHKKPKLLGKPILQDGTAVLTVSAADLTHSSIAIEFIYSGDHEFAGDTSTGRATYHQPLMG